MRRTQPAQVVLASRPAEIVVDPYRAPAAQHPVGQIGSDETGAAGDQSRPAAGGRDERNAHNVSPRATNAARASPTRSTATRPVSQLTNRSSPASSCVLG